MNLFFAIWVPLNLIFWLGCAASVKDATGLHFKVASVFAMITGVLPMLIYKFMS